MAEHIYDKNDLIKSLDGILNKTLGEIDNKEIFQNAQKFNLQKGIAGTVIEQCVFGYPPDTKQEADLIIVDGEKQIKTELKTTGMKTKPKNGKHYIAKEPMSITAVGVYDLASQDFLSSHFWEKLEHMLLVYYHYTAAKAVPPYKYKDFPVIDYEFHEFSEDDIETLRKDWECVHSLVNEVVRKFPGEKNKEWKELVKNEYLLQRGRLRKELTYIDLAPKFPPRFRLKKPVVSSMISNHFGYKLEQLPGRYTVISDIDRKCKEITSLYGGKTIGELADEFGIPRITDSGNENKGIVEQVVVKMFGGKSKKLNKIELFSRFGLIAKSIAVTPSGGRTEDMKLFHIDFEEIVQKEYMDEDGVLREKIFEDSELYSYFADHEFLCIMLMEPETEYAINEETGKKEEVKHPLTMNKFLGFKRLVFSDDFIDMTVRKVWEDTRDKIMHNKVEDVIQRYKDGREKILKCGEVSSAPNFIKSAENAVFIRGSAQESSSEFKTESVNGVKMLPQYVWIKGKEVADLLKELPLL